MDIRDGLILMRLRSYVEGAKRASQQAVESESADKWISGYANAMIDVLEYMDMLDGLRKQVGELMEKDK